jgi:hypothetical protein
MAAALRGPCIKVQDEEITVESYEDKMKISFANFAVPETGGHMVVYHAGCLHVGVDDR